MSPPPTGLPGCWTGKAKIPRGIARIYEVPPIANFRLADDPPGGDNKRYGVLRELGHLNERN